MVPVLPISVALLFVGALVSGVVAAMSAKDRQFKQLQRSVISLAVFSSACMLVTAVYWIPGAFFPRAIAPPPAFLPPPVAMPGGPTGRYR